MKSKLRKQCICLVHFVSSPFQRSDLYCLSLDIQTFLSMFSFVSYLFWRLQMKVCLFFQHTSLPASMMFSLPHVVPCYPPSHLKHSRHSHQQTVKVSGELVNIVEHLAAWYYQHIICNWGFFLHFFLLWQPAAHILFHLEISQPTFHVKIYIYIFQKIKTGSRKKYEARLDGDGRKKERMENRNRKSDSSFLCTTHLSCSHLSAEGKNYLNVVCTGSDGGNAKCRVCRK